MVLDRATGEPEHRSFADVLDYLRPGDLMVFNQSRVIPARLFGVRDDNGGRVEFLLLRREADGVWEALARPGRRLRPGATELPSGLSVEVLESRAEGLKAVRLSSETAIDRMGHTPLPPYIRSALDDPARYQTVYAKEPGSAAAPTAGLHFTPELLSRISESGVETAFVTLHVGFGPFRSGAVCLVVTVPLPTCPPTAHIHDTYSSVLLR
ncbi:S-adenosylmethionine:tRNA ribosyltransferase-isomerase [Geodia barretti]|uniref:S-adenosylmethionine:tRNA ribosyltransferase-isomerase n=1 Tax=Geodia barretti TaxID=519541 RepID=A0AA35VSA3_GEOBA|nr:S-adenosylmethionine:tRNA ribosyltransferase-isomerase [Geodia barretti]